MCVKGTALLDVLFTLLNVTNAINIFLAHFRFFRKRRILLMLLGTNACSPTPTKISIDILGTDFKWGSGHHWTPLAMALFLLYKHGFILVCNLSLFNPLKRIAATFLTKLCNSITCQWPVAREVFKPSTDSARHADSPEKNFSFGFGVFLGARHKWGCFWPILPGLRNQSNELIF